MSKRNSQNFVIGGLAERVLNLKGRYAWALKELIIAGQKGCTSIDNPGPRLAAYIHVLRHEHGLKIDTIHEKHAGLYPGTHARYILRTPVHIIENDRRAA